MPVTFICKNCKKETKSNFRLKVKQKYCGLSACQRARKNQWEKDKLKKDKTYREKRKKTKAKWRNNRPAHEYQRKYRESNPDYVEQNRKKQKFRNAKRNASVFSSKIVKTDALNTQSLFTSGLYELVPYNPDTREKIVKTDSLIVHIADIQRHTVGFLNNSP